MNRQRSSMRIPFGGPAVIPQNDVARLSYYLKCCLFCTPMQFTNVPLALFDYHNVGRLPRVYHDLIYRLAFQHVSIQLQLARGIVLIDDTRQRIPDHASNTFVDGPTISGDTKIMICTSQWIQEYFLGPYHRYLFMPTNIASSTMQDSNMVPTMERTLSAPSSIVSPQNMCAAGIEKSCEPDAVTSSQPAFGQANAPATFVGVDKNEDMNANDSVRRL